MKKLTILLLIAITMCIIIHSCGPNENEIRKKIEKELKDSIKAEEAKAEALHLEEERKYPYDGIYEWNVEFYNLIGELYSEEVGCEIINGKVVNATWYDRHARSPMVGTLEGNVLHLKGNNATYPSLWMECEVDLRTGRGKAANNLVPSTEAKFRKNN